MPIDKSWINIKNRLSNEFWNGLQGFIEYAKDYVNEEGNISCPCRKCVNGKMVPLKDVKGHIFEYGFDVTYAHWVFHGEPPEVPIFASRAVECESEDEMVGVLNDIAGETLNQDLRGETSNNMSEEIHTEFEDLLSELQTELYPGCTKFSSLNFLVKLMHLKVLYKWPNDCMDSVLKLLKDALPDGNKLPTSHYESKKKLKKLGLGYEKIHVCKYDCALFWKSNADLQTCPICNTSRWKTGKEKKVPWKVLRYFPLKDRLRRLFVSRHTAKEMTWHLRGKSTDPDVLRHPVDGKEWQEFDKKYPDFSCEPRNVRLALSTDGFNPFGNMSLSYSMWPVVVIVYNLPPWLCTKDPYKFLTLLIPGPTPPGKDIDVFLRPLIDELKELWSEGFVVHDAANNTNFKMRAALLMTISDFPARSSLSGWSGQGYFACPSCNVDTPSMRITSKICYVGHRKWLPKDHALRKNKKFNGHVDRSTPPNRISTQEMLDQLHHVTPRVPGKHGGYGGNKRKRKRQPQELNWTKKSIFWELPYWRSLSLRHNLDVMHIEKNVCESLLGTILSIDRKSKDTDKARVDLANLGVREELHLFEDGDTLMKPHAAYTLSPKDCTKFCEFLKNVRFPDGFASNLGKNMVGGNSKISGLKSHDCHVIMQRLLPTGIRPFMNKEIVDAISELCSFFQLISSRTVRVSDLKKAQEEIVVILCKLEMIFPPAFFDIMVHVTMHLPEEALWGGPVHLRWMYAIERFLGSLKKYVTNRAHPEGSIAEAYIANEALTFCSMYLNDIETRFNRLERNWNESGDDLAEQISVFRSQIRCIGKMTPTTLDHNMRNQAEWYVLQNCPEVQQYIDEHREHIIAQSSITSLEEIQAREFPEWFQRKVFALQECLAPELDKRLIPLAFRSSPTFKSYPGCVVNGVKFLTHRRDMNRVTQNSGIFVKGIDGQVFYGQLEDIYEMTYGGNKSIVLFKCKWYNTSVDRRGQRRGIKEYQNKMSICIKDVWYENEPFILASQAEQVFYVDDIFNGPHWKVVEHFGHRNIWDLPPNEGDDMCIVQDVESSGIRLHAEIPNIDVMLWNESSIPPDVVSTDVRVLTKSVQDDFISDEEDETCYGYNEEGEDEALGFGGGDEDDDSSDDDQSTKYISSDDD